MPNVSVALRHAKMEEEGYFCGLAEADSTTPTEEVITVALEQTPGEAEPIIHAITQDKNWTLGPDNSELKGPRFYAGDRRMSSIDRQVMESVLITIEHREMNWNVSIRTGLRTGARYLYIGETAECPEDWDAEDEIRELVSSNFRNTVVNFVRYYANE